MSEQIREHKKIIPLALIRDDEVRVPLHELVQQAVSPNGFIIDDGHLQSVERKRFQVIQCLDALFLRPEKDARMEREGCSFLHVLWPYRAHRCRSHYQHSFNPALLPSDPHHRDGGQGFSAAHFKQKPESLIDRIQIKSPPFFTFGAIMKMMFFPEDITSTSAHQCPTPMRSFLYA